jgi:hypothetical protein
LHFIKAGSQQGSQLGNLADKYHVSSRNSGATKRNFTAQEINYLNEIRELVSEAPLRLNDCPRISMPNRRKPNEMTLEEAITRRRSERWFANSSIPAADLASLLYLANGVRDIAVLDSAQKIYQRNVPNAGSLGSVEIYPIVMNADMIEPGIYHYDSITHDLAIIQLGQFPYLARRIGIVSSRVDYRCGSPYSNQRCRPPPVEVWPSRLPPWSVRRRACVGEHPSSRDDVGAWSVRNCRLRRRRARSRVGNRRDGCGDNARDCDRAKGANGSFHLAMFIALPTCALAWPKSGSG